MQTLIYKDEKFKSDPDNCININIFVRILYCFENWGKNWIKVTGYLCVLFSTKPTLTSIKIPVKNIEREGDSKTLTNPCAS